MLHLLFLVFPLLALAAFAVAYRILFPEKNGGWIAVLFLCSMPAFFVNAQTMMCDVPTLTFLLLSMTAYVFFTERGMTSGAYAGGIFLTLAVFTSYQAVFFIAAVFVFMMARKKLNLHGIASLALPLAGLFVWFLLVYHTHGLFPFLKGGNSSSQSGSLLNLVRIGLGNRAFSLKGISMVADIGSSMICLLPLYIIFNKTGVKFLGVFLVLAMPGYWLISSMTGYSFGENIFLSFLFVLGLMTLLVVVIEVFKPSHGRKDTGRGVFLLLWIVLILIINMVTLPWIAARHVLPVYPPMVMMLVNGLGNDLSRLKKLTLYFMLALSILFGVGSAFSDYKFAESYRAISADSAHYRSDGNTIWYIGKWGMQYYMEKAGAHYLFAASNEPQAGDIVIIPEMPRLWMPSQELRERLELVDQKAAISPLPIRLFNRRSHAGFYSSAWGLLPFSFSQEPDEVFLIFRVER